MMHTGDAVRHMFSYNRPYGSWHLGCPPSPHAADALVPALDHAAHAQLKGDGVVAVQGGVKLGAVHQAPLVQQSTGGAATEESHTSTAVL